MTTTTHRAEFDQRYQSHLKHLKLKGLQPKTIDAYAGRYGELGRTLITRSSICRASNSPTISAS